MINYRFHLEIFDLAHKRSQTSREYFIMTILRNIWLLPNSQVLHFTIFILQQLEKHLDNLPLAVIIQLDGVLLQLGHQVIGGHEPEVLVTGRHLQKDKDNNSPFIDVEQKLTFSSKCAIPVILLERRSWTKLLNDN